MGLVDRIKDVAGDMGEVAKKGASQMQTKVEQAQVRRRADDAAKRLGYLVYHQRTGAATGGGDVDALIAEIADAEAQIEAARAARAAEPAPSGPEVPPPAPGQAPEEATGE
jgi:hypothetical protein